MIGRTEVNIHEAIGMAQLITTIGNALSQSDKTANTVMYLRSPHKAVYPKEKKQRPANPYANSAQQINGKVDVKPDIREPNKNRARKRQQGRCSSPKLRQRDSP